eukprot:543253-Prymnesium_polylepis.1
MVVRGGEARAEVCVDWEREVPCGHVGRGPMLTRPLDVHLYEGMRSGALDKGDVWSWKQVECVGARAAPVLCSL